MEEKRVRRALSRKATRLKTIAFQTQKIARSELRIQKISHMQAVNLGHPKMH